MGAGAAGTPSTPQGVAAYGWHLPLKALGSGCVLDCTMRLIQKPLHACGQPVPQLLQGGTNAAGDVVGKLPTPSWPEGHMQVARHSGPQ